MSLGNYDEEADAKKEKFRFNQLFDQDKGVKTRLHARFEYNSNEFYKHFKINL